MVRLTININGSLYWLNEGHLYCTDYRKVSDNDDIFFFLGKSASTLIIGCKNKAEYYKIKKLKVFI